MTDVTVPETNEARDTKKLLKIDGILISDGP